MSFIISSIPEPPIIYLTADCSEKALKQVKAALLHHHWEFWSNWNVYSFYPDDKAKSDLMMMCWPSDSCRHCVIFVQMVEYKFGSVLMMDLLIEFIVNRHNSTVWNTKKISWCLKSEICRKIVKILPRRGVQLQFLLNISKSKGLTTLKTWFAPHNAMIAVIFMGLLTS